MMLAVTIAARDDVYGVVYALILGLLLTMPHRLLLFTWLPAMLAVGLLLIWQYSVLLGMPPFALCDNSESVQLIH